MIATEDEVDDFCQSVYDLFDSDDKVMIFAVEYLHEHKKEVADYINNRLGEK